MTSSAVTSGSVAPRKILFTIPNLVTAGSGRAMLNLASRLDRNRFEPSFCVQELGGNALEQDVRDAGIPLLEATTTVAGKPYWSLAGRCWRASRTVDQQFDLWHSFHYLDDYSEPLIARMAGARWVCTKKNMNWNDRSWRLRCSWASAVVAQNRDMMSRFFAGRRWQGKVELIPRGVDIERFQPQGEAVDLRSSLGFDSGTLLIACVAHLVPAKGVEILIRAVAELENVCLVIAGRAMDPLYEQSLRDLAHQQESAARVIFLGAVDDVAALLRGVEIFVLPTLAQGRQEGCPVALLEAMACGCACVATEIPGSRDLLDGNEAGILVSPGDVAPMAKALRQLSESAETRARLGHSARQRVESSYSLELEVERHQELYERVLGKRVLPK